MIELLLENVSALSQHSMALLAEMMYGISLRFAENTAWEWSYMTSTVNIIIRHIRSVEEVNQSVKR